MDHSCYYPVRLPKDLGRTKMKSKDSKSISLAGFIFVLLKSLGLAVSPAKRIALVEELG